MNRNRKQSLSHYQVIPRTVRSGEPTQVRVLPCGESKRFDDTKEYTVRLIPMEIFYGEGCGTDIQVDSLTVRPQNGVLTLTYAFYE